MANNKCLLLLSTRFSKILHCISTFLGLKYILTVTETDKASVFIKEGGKVEGRKGGREER